MYVPLMSQSSSFRCRVCLCRCAYGPVVATNEQAETAAASAAMIQPHRQNNNSHWMAKHTHTPLTVACSYVSFFLCCSYSNLYCVVYTLLSHSLESVHTLSNSNTVKSRAVRLQAPSVIKTVAAQVATYQLFTVAQTDNTQHIRSAYKLITLLH